MQKDEKAVYEEFVDQFCEWSETGKAPEAGDQEIRYGLSLQKERLNRYQAKMKYSLKFKGEQLDNISKYVYEGKKYSNRLVYRSYHKTVDYWINERKTLSLQDQEEFFAMVTYLNEAHIDGNETYCCPNCGAGSRIVELTDKGCTYCGTHFVMSELFPKVTNFYCLKDYGIDSMDGKEAKNVTSNWVIAGILIGLVCISPMAFSDFFAAGKEEASMLGRIVLFAWQYIFAGILGAVLGYFAFSARLIIKLFAGAVQAVPKVAEQLKARKRITEFIQSIDSEFSYEYFFGKVQSLVKLIIFTDDRSDLAVYEGNLPLDRFNTIVDSQFDGVLGLNRAWIEAGYCFLDLNVYMTNIYIKNSRIKKKSDVIRIRMCRKKDLPIDYGFSINKVNCKSCGGSFDASKIKHCPYCSNAYDLKEDDWVITYIH